MATHNPTPNPVPNPTTICNPIPNPNPNRNPNLTARATKYLATVLNQYGTKTAHVQAEDKYTTKANLHFRIHTSDQYLFRYNVN